MNYVPFPRIDMDTHGDLVFWRSKTPKMVGDWKSLRKFLHDSTRILKNDSLFPKCWYSESPQGDPFALDVEHYRPKNSGDPLNTKQVNAIKDRWGADPLQNNIAGVYHWLEHDYRNYRLVTAKTNRSGAKHTYFPIAINSNRLSYGQEPWANSQTELPLFLDPTNKEDTSLLFVKPNGEIAPITPLTTLTPTEINNPITNWRNDGYNYLRSVVTIELFNLNFESFISGRSEFYHRMESNLYNLELAILENSSNSLLEAIIGQIIMMLMPASSFSLASKSALQAHIPKNSNIISEFSKIRNRIISHVENEIEKIVISWDNP